MYESFYGLTDKPFALTPNPRFVFYSQQYREAEGQLLYGINNREGFMLVSGKPGTGKTTLCRDLIDKLDRSRIHSALVFNPFLNAVEMLAAVLSEFNVMTPEGASRKELLDRLNQFLLAQLVLGKSCVAIFDEAQHLSAEFLEQIRVLSNLETDHQKLLQIILVGQPELLDRIRTPGMAQLDQRVSIRCTLTDLDEQEADRYIHHRLDVAGARGQVRFSPRALREIFKASHGVPRLINLICDRALLAAYAEQTRDIDVPHVRKAVAALSGEETDIGRAARARGVRWLRYTAIGTVAAALVVGAVLAGRQIEAAQSTDQTLYAGATGAASPAEAERQYTELIRKFPQSPYTPDAYLALAQLQMTRGDYKGAIESLEQTRARVRAGPVKSRAIIWTALAQLSAGDTVNACATLADTDSVASRDPLLRPQLAEVASHCGARGTPAEGNPATDSVLGAGTPSAPTTAAGASPRGALGGTAGSAKDSLAKRPAVARPPGRARDSNTVAHVEPIRLDGLRALEESL